MSPISFSSRAIFFNILLTILPLLVFGRPEDKCNTSGVATGPILFRTGQKTKTLHALLSLKFFCLHLAYLAASNPILTSWCTRSHF